MNAHFKKTLWILSLALMSICFIGCSVSQFRETTQGRETGPPEELTFPSVTHFAGEDPGFVILEEADMTAKWVNQFDQAVALMENDDFEKALPILENVVNLEPGVSAPYIDLAMAYRKVEQYDLAEEALRNALTLIPNHPVAQNELGLVQRSSGRFDEARTTYEQALEEFPEYLPLRLNLGILCEIYLNDDDCALEQYSLYSQDQPENEQVKLWIADIKFRNGDM
jgi:Flp pilus assembly protein TadD